MVLNTDFFSGSNDALEEFLNARNPKQQHSSKLESYLIKPIQVEVALQACILFAEKWSLRFFCFPASIEVSFAIEWHVEIIGQRER